MGCLSLQAEVLTEMAGLLLILIVTNWVTSRKHGFHHTMYLVILVIINIPTFSAYQVQYKY